MTNLLGWTGRWAWSRALFRASGPMPHPTRRNWTFDVTLALALAAVVLIFTFSADFDVPDNGPPPPEPGTSVYVPDGGHARPAPPEPPVPPAGSLPHQVFDDPPTPYDGLESEGALLALMAILPLVVRRRYPLAVLWIAVVAAALTPQEMPWVTFYACVIAAYSAAAYSPYRMAVYVSTPVMFVAAGTLTGEELTPVPSQWVPLMVMVPITIAANGLRMWKLRTDDERVRAEKLERERAEAVRLAAEEERARIARELHDVVTHNVSVMVIQAGAARKIMDTDPERSREALLAVEAGGRAAMTELRHVMGLLTVNDDPDEPDLAPQPGLGQVEALVARVRDAGLPVELAVTGDARELPSGVDLTAYRIVQEALTNTVKHAGGASAAVSIAYRPDLVRIEVADTGGTRTPSAAGGNGRGLIGLRERLAVYGGTLEAGPRPTGGYRVTAHIPLE